MGGCSVWAPIVRECVLYKRMSSLMGLLYGVAEWQVLVRMPGSQHAVRHVLFLLLRKAHQLDPYRFVRTVCSLEECVPFLFFILFPFWEGQE